MANQLNDIPSSLEPLASFRLGEKEIFVTISSVWYKFFTSVSALLSNLVGGVLGFTAVIGKTATGTTQTTALGLEAEWTQATVVPANSGVRLNNFGAGVPSTVFNQGANTLRIYPPVGGQIDGLGANNPYLLATTKMQVFSQLSATEWRSMQLG